MSALVEVSGLNHVLGKCQVLRGIGFEIQVGKNVALLGPSGCGKTTLLRLLAGLDAPTAGRVLIDGQTVSQDGRVFVAPHRRGIGMVFQDLALWPGLTALENVIVGIPPAALSRKERRAGAQRMLQLCGLGALEHRQPSQLSAGQQQRVALARAVVGKPRILLLDEPFTGLDLTVKHDLIREVSDMALRFGATVILVSHDPWEVSSMCTRTLVLENGIVAEQGVLSELLDAPTSQTLKAMTCHFGRQATGNTAKRNA